VVYLWFLFGSVHALYIIVFASVKEVMVSTRVSPTEEDAQHRFERKYIHTPLW
jgi:hypothetical protein